MRRAALPVLAAAALLLVGCAPTVTLTPGPAATAVGCASVVVALPQTVGQADRRNTDAQGTAAWGTPVSVTLRCGVETPEASTLRCYPRGDVDWLVSTSGDDRVLTTYGRTPGVQIVTTPDSSINDALADLNEAVAAGTKRTSRRCLAAVDPGAAAPSPSATP